MNKKYLLIASIFIAGFSYDSFAGHFDHFDHHEDHNDTHASECQACEENFLVKVSPPNKKIFYNNIDWLGIKINRSGEGKTLCPDALYI